MESREQNIRVKHAALAGIVAPFAVVIPVQLLAGAVGGAGDGRLPGTALDLLHIKVEQSHRCSPPSAGLMTALGAVRRSDQ